MELPYRLRLLHHYVQAVLDGLQLLLLALNSGALHAVAVLVIT